MRLINLSTALLVGGSILVNAQSCPSIHIFAAREKHARPGYGATSDVVDFIKGSFPEATSEAINYPAWGGCPPGMACGSDIRDLIKDSVRNGTIAVYDAVTDLNKRCPGTKIVLVGYSQGAYVMDNAFCGGVDTYAGFGHEYDIPSQATKMVKAVVWAGNPRYQKVLPYSLGTCRYTGTNPRPDSFQCAGASKIQSYCLGGDADCCPGTGGSDITPLYVRIYGQKMLEFVTTALGSDE